MARTRCTDRVVGAILASWRYDISGISPEMRKDYEQHLAECAHCSARQRFHRSLDVTLVVLTSLSVFFFLFALAVLKHIKPLEHVAINMFGLDIFDMYHMLVSAGIAGLCSRVIAFALVLMATPAPSYLGGIAAERAKLLEERLPEAIKCYVRGKTRDSDAPREHQTEGLPSHSGRPLVLGCRAYFAIGTRISPPVICLGRPSLRSLAAWARCRAASRRCAGGSGWPLRRRRSTAPGWWCARCAGRR